MEPHAYCPSCDESFSVRSDTQKIPYPSGGKDSVFRTIACCNSCDLGILHPSFNDEEVTNLYHGGGFWGEAGSQVRRQFYAMAYTLAKRRWAYMAKHVSFSGSVRILDIGAGHGCMGMVAAKELKNRFKEYVVVKSGLETLCSGRSFTYYRKGGRE
jgi:hypothetical protein